MLFTENVCSIFYDVEKIEQEAVMLYNIKCIDDLFCSEQIETNIAELAIFIEDYDLYNMCIELGINFDMDKTGNELKGEVIAAMTSEIKKQFVEQFNEIVDNLIDYADENNTCNAENLAAQYKLEIEFLL